MENNYSILEGEIRTVFASVVWTHKIQEKQADIYAENYKRLETAKILSASLTSAGIISLLFTDQLWVKLVSALLSFISVFVSAYFRSFNLNNLLKLHKTTANQLLYIRDELRLLLLDIRMQSVRVEDVAEKYKGIVAELHAVYNDAPSTTDKAVNLAEKALKITKDNTFSEEEINEFLPEKLRKE